MKKYIIMLLTVIFFVSCSSLKKIVEPPKVKLNNVQVNKMAISGVDLDVILEVKNPNNIDFDVKNLTYSLDVNDKLVTSGKLKEKLLVKAKSTTIVSVPLTIKYTDILSSAILYLQEQGMPYRVKGSVELGPFTIPFDDAGSLRSVDQ